MVREATGDGRDFGVACTTAVQQPVIEVRHPCTNDPSGDARRIDTAEIDGSTWHGRLFAWSYSSFGGRPPEEFDLWLYCLTVLAAGVFMICAFLICVVLNLFTLPVGVFAEPIWRANPRFRRFTLPGGTQIPYIAAPILGAIAAWRNWAESGMALTVGPIVVTGCLGFLLLGCSVLLNRMRSRSRRLSIVAVADKPVAR